MSPADPAFPLRSPWLVRWFTRYACRYTRKHFHAVRRSRTSSPVPADGLPLLFVVNHPSWWDVMMMFVGVGLHPHYRHYAPIEAAMLQKYRFFKRLGLFGVEPTPRGGAKFLRTAQAIFAESHGAMWVTAQGRFADVRERPLALKSGVAAIACRMKTGHVVPLALEYTFWEERTPEALFRFGEPLDVSRFPESSADDWLARIEVGLTATMDHLAAESQRRDPTLFESILVGRRGIGGVYDLWRRLTGRGKQLGHGVEP